MDDAQLRPELTVADMLVWEAMDKGDTKGHIAGHRLARVITHRHVDTSTAEPPLTLLATTGQITNLPLLLEQITAARRSHPPYVLAAWELEALEIYVTHHGERGPHPAWGEPLPHWIDT